MVGSAIVRALKARGYSNLLLRTRQELDLMDQSAVREFLQTEKPEYVFDAAARVGGIAANDAQPVDFLYENLQIQNHLIHGAWEAGVKKLMFLGSSCIYPRDAKQPMKESALLTGPLELTNQWYAIAKIAGIKLCQAFRKQHGCDFISVMPTNLYGPNDNYDLESSHVLPALIRKFHEAKEAGAPTVTCWGTGSPYREFLYADDLADACLFLMENYSDEEIVNVGSQKEVTIRQLAELIGQVVGYDGEIVWDVSRPDGTPRKLMDSSKLAVMGWRPKVGLEEGIGLAYENFKKSHCQVSASS